MMVMLVAWCGCLVFDGNGDVDRKLRIYSLMMVPRWRRVVLLLV